MITRPVFAYWTGDNRAVHNDLINDWQGKFPHFQIFGDAEVLPILNRYFPDRKELYSQIRIPAAKADIARLLLLYEHGGLYIDCHCGIRDADEIRNLFNQLLDYDAIFVDRMLSLEPRPPDEHLVINGIIFCRPHLDLIFRMCRQALSNFARQRNNEHRAGFVPYDIWSLSGARLVTAMLLEPGSFNRDLRWDYQGRIRIIREEIAPIVRNRYRAYSKDRQHWSQRQNLELLFDSPKEQTGAPD